MISIGGTPKVDLMSEKSDLPSRADGAVEECARSAFLGLEANFTEVLNSPNYHWFLRLQVGPDADQFAWKLLRTGKYWLEP